MNATATIANDITEYTATIATIANSRGIYCAIETIANDITEYTAIILFIYFYSFYIRARFIVYYLFYLIIMVTFYLLVLSLIILIFSLDHLLNMNVSYVYINSECNINI